MKAYVLLVASLAMSTALAAKPCEEVKSEIAAKLDAKHVSGYTLDVVPAEQAGDGKVIGSCEGGSKKIVYTRK
jgi:hypothetical protein